MERRKMIYSKYKKINGRKGVGSISIDDVFLKKHIGKNVVVEIYEV